MAPKKGKKGGKGKKIAEPEPVIDRTFYDEQITVLNHILSDLRTQQKIVELENERLLKEKDDLQNDEKDILQYLSRATQELNDEIAKLDDQCNTVDTARVKAEREFEHTKEKMMDQFHETEDQLLSDYKLIVGKMHALEEFRVQRDELMKKYEIMENIAEEQKIRHKRQIYDVERKYIIGKDKLKKEMDAKLRWLVEEFLSVTDLRVAATSFNVIKENIALNNKLDEMLQTLRKLYEKHESLRDNDIKLKLLTEMTNYDVKVVGQKARSLYSNIIRTTNECYLMQRNIVKLHKIVPKLHKCEWENQICLNEIDENVKKKRILEQNLHEFRCQRQEITSDIRHQTNRNKELHEMLQRAKDMIEAKAKCNDAYSIQEFHGEGGMETESKSTMLYKLYDYLKLVREWNRHPGEVERLENRDDIYMPGRLSLVPREVIFKSMIPTKDTKCEQVDDSFIDLLDESHGSEGSEEESMTEIEELHSIATIVSVLDQEAQTDEEKSEQNTTISLISENEGKEETTP